MQERVSPQREAATDVKRQEAELSAAAQPVALEQEPALAARPRAEGQVAMVARDEPQALRPCSFRPAERTHRRM